MTEIADGWDAVAVSHGTDKASTHHGYMGVYEKVLSGLKVEKLLEIGVAHGKSLKMWEQLFPDALIVGVDNEPKCRFHQRLNIAVLIADANDPSKMAAVSQLHGPFQVIIDDGSHQHKEVQAAFEELWWRLDTPGVYIIEDLDHTDQFVKDFIKQWDAEWFPCDDKVGQIKEPGLIVVRKS